MYLATIYKVYKKRGCAYLSAVAEERGCSKPSVPRGLKTLEEKGYIIYDNITLRQYGSTADIGFSIKNEAEFNGTNMFAFKILAGCEIPFVQNGVFDNKVVENEMTFLNAYYGLSGDIPGSCDDEEIIYWEQ